MTHMYPCTETSCMSCMCDPQYEVTEYFFLNMTKTLKNTLKLQQNIHICIYLNIYIYYIFLVKYIYVDIISF